MPEAPGNPPSPRTPLFWDGARWHYGLVDDDGRVQVRGEDQLFSIREPLHVTVNFTLVVGQMYIRTGGVPADELWVVTTIVARDTTTPLTQMRFVVNDGGVTYFIGENVRAIAAGEQTSWRGHTYLGPTDSIWALFDVGLVGDVTDLWITGYRMTLEV